MEQVNHLFEEIISDKKELFLQKNENLPKKHTLSFSSLGQQSNKPQDNEVEQEDLQNKATKLKKRIGTNESVQQLKKNEKFPKKALKNYLDEQKQESENSNSNILFNVHNNKKITDFFPKHQNESKNNQPQQKRGQVQQQQTLLKKLKNVKGQKDEQTQEIGFLRREILQIQQQIEQKEQRISQTVENCEKISQQTQMIRQQIQVQENNFKNEQEKIIDQLKTYLIKNEVYRRNISKNKLENMRYKLGKFVSKIVQGRLQYEESWEDGAELKQSKEDLLLLQMQRKKKEEERDKYYKSQKPKKIAQMQTRNQNGNQKNDNYKQTDLKLFSEFIQNTDSNSNGEENSKDVKERLNFQIQMLQKQEKEQEEFVKKLQQERAQLIMEYKRVNEEENCMFYNIWPFLNNQYQILSLIGKGGFGEVYKGYDCIELRDIACKIHKISHNWNESTRMNFIKHLSREINHQQNFCHPNIVKQYNFFHYEQNQDIVCSILEYCDGQDLYAYLKKHKQIPEQESKQIIRQIMAGIKYLHESKPKIIHYDLKPQNILFHEGGVKITDFGLCKVMQDEHTKLELTCQGVGTYWYLPPESFTNEQKPVLIDTKVDIWSIGVIFFEMLFGRKPFGDRMSQERILNEKVILNATGVEFPQKPRITEECKKFIEKCLMYHPSDRYDIEQAWTSNYFSKNLKNF